VQQFSVEPGDDTGSVISFLEDRLYEHNSRETGRDDGRLFSNVVRDSKGDIIAGVAGWTWATACEITQLWVSQGVRNKGIGKLLLQAAEDRARDQNCMKVLVRTYSFQAPHFYEKYGYKIEHVMDNFPEAHRHYTLVKSIATDRR
jgi:GNAT superfamily N-acetyltransferase